MTSSGRYTRSVAVYEPKYVRVTAPGQRLDHIVRLGMFNDGGGKSLCGIKPWPDMWEEVMPGAVDGPACAGCQVKLK